MQQNNGVDVEYIFNPYILQEIQTIKKSLCKTEGGLCSFSGILTCSSMSLISNIMSKNTYILNKSKNTANCEERRSRKARIDERNVVIYVITKNTS